MTQILVKQGSIARAPGSNERQLLYLIKLWKSQRHL